MPLQAGRLDRRITLQRATITYDALNSPVETWAEIATVWASKEDLRDSEVVAAKEVGAEMTRRYRIRYSQLVSDLDSKDRVSAAGRIEQIVNVKELDRRVGLEITTVLRTD